MTKRDKQASEYAAESYEKSPTERGVSHMSGALTDEEREAIEDAAGICEEHAEEYDGTDNSPIAATLRRMLERLS